MVSTVKRGRMGNSRTARPVRQHQTGLATHFRCDRKEGVTLMIEHPTPRDCPDGARQDA